MVTINRSILSVALSTVLGMQYSSNAVADSANYVLLAKADGISEIRKVYTEKPENEWGWWNKYDWESYKQSGISKKDLKMLKLAAKSGNSQAQYVLGMLYSTEDRVEKSTYWLSKAADQGHSSAKFVYNYMTDTSGDFGIGC